MKNGLQSIKALSIKLQKRDSDICNAYSLIDFAMEEVKSFRTDIDAVWDSWYTEVCEMADEAGTSMSILRTTSVQRNRPNVPADSPR